MINYTQYIRRLSLCFDERITELSEAQTVEGADCAYYTCYGWLAGAVLAAGCLTDSDLRGELQDELEGWRSILTETYSIRIDKLCGTKGGDSDEGA